MAVAAARPARATSPAAPRPSTPASRTCCPGGGQITPLIPGNGLDLDGDGDTDAGLSILPLEDVEFDADTKTGTIKLGGGLIIDLPALELADQAREPRGRHRRHRDASGLYAHINGVRVKVGDIDTDTLDLDIARRHRHDQAAQRDRRRRTLRTASAGPRHGPDPGGTPLLKLDLSFPEL